MAESDYTFHRIAVRENRDSGELHCGLRVSGALTNMAVCGLRRNWFVVVGRTWQTVTHTECRQETKRFWKLPILPNHQDWLDAYDQAALDLFDAKTNDGLDKDQDAVCVAEASKTVVI